MAPRLGRALGVPVPASGQALVLDAPRGGSGRYELLAKIASGGMATVYVARLRSAVGTSRLVAIKRAHPHLLEDRTFAAMFIAEAKLASRIHHANVVAVHDVELVGDEALLVMDYVEGASLDDLADEEDVPIPTTVAVRVLVDVCAGLEAAHRLTDDDGKPLHIVHRDISPHNILVGLDGVARLSDFGIAKSTRASARGSAAGTLKGKLAYMAPEYMAEGKLDAKSDIFSLGIVAWEAVTRRRLFRGESEVDSMRLVLAGAVPRPSEVAPWLGDSLDEPIVRALARDPRERFESAEEFGEALHAAALRGEGVATVGQVAAHVRAAFGEALAERRAQLRDPGGETEPFVPDVRQSRRSAGREAVTGTLPASKPVVHALPALRGRRASLPTVPSTPVAIDGGRDVAGGLSTAASAPSAEVGGRLRRGPRVLLAVLALGIVASIVVAGAFFARSGASALTTDRGPPSAEVGEAPGARAVPPREETVSSPPTSIASATPPPVAVPPSAAGPRPPRAAATPPRVPSASKPPKAAGTTVERALPNPYGP